MFEKICKEETERLVKKRLSRSTRGLTDELRNQFSVMTPGESFIYPLPDDLSSGELGSRIRGTCYSLGVSIRTKKMESGILVVYKGEK